MFKQTEEEENLKANFVLILSEKEGKQEVLV